ncbi:MAG: FHIPEP family type III secretion protein [Pseudomonadota bacterium]
MSLANYFRLASERPEGPLARYSDLLLVAGVVAIVALMVLPLPALMIDLLVALNIACGLTLLLVAIYIATPLEFSVFPSVLLITTLFRLSLAIATTRMILLEGHAGHIIDTFGKMVAGGNLVVGLVVFLIITVVQFIVIAKGAERVAEVAARFSLDAMPGKQLSIDSDLRSGLIDKDEARRKRRELELESKLHGSLDGAMKFVKGDAIAGIVIIIINLLGGLAVGVLQQGMDMGSAMVKYSILTIGDGMVSQIPALLGAMSAGLIVTRTTDESHRHLGDAIRQQLAAKPRVMLVAGGLCLLFALVPGFPAAVFVGLGLVLGLFGALGTPLLRQRFQRLSQPAFDAVMARREAGDQVLSTTQAEPRPAVPLLLELPASALHGEAGLRLVQALQEVLEHYQLSLGLPLPRISVHGRAEAPREGTQPAAPAWQLLAYEVPIAQGELPEGDLAAALAQAAHQALRRHAALFLGIQETSALLTRAAGDVPEVVKEVMRALPMQRVAEILRRLVEEEVPIRHLRDVLETLADVGQREKDVHTLTEYARIALKRQISHRHAPQGQLRALLLEPELENQLRDAIRVSGGVHQLALDPASAQAILDRFSAAIAQHRPDAVVAPVDLRRHLRKLIEPDAFDTPVLSYQELVPTLKLDLLDRVGLPGSPLLQAA